MKKAVYFFLYFIASLIVALGLLGLFSRDRVEIPYGFAGQYVELEGVRLRYLQKGQGPDLLLIHGTPGSIESWQPMIDRWATHYRVTVYDRPAQGFSSAPDAQLGIEYNAKVARSLIARLDLSEPLIVGHSYGGAVALEMAIEDTPARGYVIVASSVYPNPKPSLLGRVLRLPVVGRGVAELLGHIGGRIVRHGIDVAFHPDEALIPAGFVEQSQRIWLQPKVTIATAQEMFRHRDETEVMTQRYPSIRRPVFMVVGSNDKASVLAGAHRFTMEVPQSKVTVLERAGHMLPFTRVDALSKIVDVADSVPSPKTFPEAVSRGPFPTIAVMCATNDRVVAPLLRAKFGEDAFPNDIGFGSGVRCRKGEQHGLGPLMFTASPFEEAALIDFDDLQQNHTSLALKTAKGWFRTDVHLLSHDHMDPGCLGAERSRVEDVRTATTTTGQRVAIIRIVERETKWAQRDASENASVWTEIAYACRMDSTQAPSCEGPKVLATTKSPNPRNFTFENERFFVVDLGKIPWGIRKKTVLGPAGELRVE